jgi:hypothetical protein
MANFSKGAFFGIGNAQAFQTGAQLIMDNVNRKDGIFMGDNLIAINRNLSFLEDEKLMASFHAHTDSPTEQGTVWRIYVNCYFAKRAMGMEGDIVECACYQGTTARIIADYVDLADSDKGIWLYDMFEHDESMRHHKMPEHGADLYAKVKARFADVKNARVTKGEVPGVLHDIAPEKVSHAHIDLNDVTAELAALEFFFDRLVPGGTIILDDYGWLYYREQKLAEDAWLAERGYSILELPTGQGLLIK